MTIAWEALPNAHEQPVHSGYRQVVISWQRRTGGRLAGADNAMAESNTLLLLMSKTEKLDSGSLALELMTKRAFSCW